VRGKAKAAAEDDFIPVRQGSKRKKAAVVPASPLPRATPQLLDLARVVPQGKRRQFILGTQSMYPNSAEGPASIASDKTQATFQVRRVYLSGIAHCPMSALKDDWEARGLLFRNEILNLDWVTQHQGAGSILEVVLVQGAEERFLTGISHLSCRILRYSSVERQDSGQQFANRVSRICRLSKSTRARNFYLAWKTERMTPPPPPPTVPARAAAPQPVPDAVEAFRAEVHGATIDIGLEAEEATALTDKIVGQVTDQEERDKLCVELRHSIISARAAMERFIEDPGSGSEGGSPVGSDAMDVEADCVKDSELVLPAPHKAYHTVE
jgi:hypothetical protein